MSDLFPQHLMNVDAHFNIASTRMCDSFKISDLIYYVGTGVLHICLTATLVYFQ